MKRAIALPGGGGRGIITCHVLAAFQERLRHHSHDARAHIADYCDLIVGTSTGGILACALAAKCATADDLARLYYKHLPDIFRHSWMRRIFRPLTSRFGMLSARYSATGLERMLHEVLGDATMQDCQTRLLVTAWSWSDEHVLLDSDRTPFTLLTDVARATAAAPTYFEPSHQPPLWLADGGLWANDPSGLCYTAFEAPVPGESIARNLSIATFGTGAVRQGIQNPHGASAWTLLPGVLRATLKGGPIMGNEILRAAYRSADAERHLHRFDIDLTDERDSVQSMDATDDFTLNRWRTLGHAIVDRQFDELDALAKLWVEEAHPYAPPPETELDEADPVVIEEDAQTEPESKVPTDEEK